MRKIKLLLVLLLTVATATVSFGQGEASNWYFGEQLGLSFTSGSPQLITGLPALGNSGAGNNDNEYLMETSASMSDKSGNYLFSISSNKIFSANKTVAGTLSNKWAKETAQGALIIPKPNTPNQYWVTTAPYGTAACVSPAPSYLSVTVNGITGNNITVGAETNLTTPNVTQGQLVLPKADATGALTGDYWLIYHGVNNNTLYVYTVTSTGITLTSTQAKGPVMPCSGATGSPDITAYFKANACYNQFAYSYGNDVFLFDFDIKTGVITYTSKTVSPITEAYGLEFSSNGRYLYVSTGTTGGAVARPIYQIPVNPGGPGSTLGASVLLGNTLPLLRGSCLQLAPDGNIYFVGMNSWGPASTPVDYLGVIGNPNGPVATFNNSLLAFPSNSSTTQSGMGLPSFITSLVSSIAAIKIGSNDLAVSQVCKGTPVTMVVNINGGMSTTTGKDKAEWIINGGTPFYGNTTTQTFNTVGKIPVQVTVWDLCDNAKIIKDTIRVVDYETATATANMGTCPKPTLTGNGASNSNYKWYDKDPSLPGAVLLGVGPTFIADPSTTYWVQPTGKVIGTIGNTGGTGAASTTTSGEYTEFSISKSVFLNTVNITTMSWGACTGNISWELRSGSVTGTLVSSGTVTASACNVNLPININSTLTPGKYFMVYKGGGGGVSDGGAYIATNTSIAGVATISGGSKWGSPYNGPFSSFKFVDDVPCKIATKIDVGLCCTVPVITTQPAAQSVCQTETATFGVTMASSPASTVVKWQKVTTAA
ncbi:MAG: hypothetical protein RLZZ175_3423, partial [Bacteroidota bacterium]